MKRYLCLLFYSSSLLFATDIYEEGIRFQSFKNIRQQLQPKPLAEKGLYQLQQLWQRCQSLGFYSGSGNTLEVYKLRSLYPKLKEKISLKDFYALHDDEASFRLNQKMTQSWIEKVTDSKISQYRQHYNQIKALHSYRYYKFNENSNSYAFLLKYKTDFYLFDFKLDPKQGDKHHTYLKNFLGSLRISGKQQAALKLPLKTATPTERYKKTLAKAQQSIKGKKGWWIFETKNYIVKSNLPKNKKKLADELLLKLEIMRSTFERFLPPRKPIEATSVVTILKDRQSYIDYVPKSVPRWSAGVWIPRMNELSLFVGWSETDAIQTVYHEAFHQYLHYLLKKSPSPSWFNEGHAVFVEPSKFSDGGRQVQMLESPNHLKKARKLIGKSIQVENFLYWDFQRFYKTPGDSYACAWAIVYFLRKAPPLFPDKKYERINPKLLVAIQRGKKWKEAVEFAFEDINIVAFQADLMQFLKSSKLRQKAQAL